MAKTAAANKALQVIREPDRADYSEEMQACMPRERLLILALLEGKSNAAAAREAGYGEADSTANTLARIAYRALQRDRVITALASEARKCLRAMAPDAVRAVREIMNDVGHKDRLKAVGMVFDRIDPTITKVEGEIKHVHTLDHESEALNQLRTLKGLAVAREKLIEVFGEFGLERLEDQLAIADRGKAPIDAEYVEVIRDPDEDILGQVHE